MENTSESGPKKQNLISLIKSPVVLKSIAGLAIGGTLGFLYYRFVGCSSGRCAITSNPYLSTLFGAVAGFVFFFSPGKKSESKSNSN
jgi:hypothetical protein